MPNIVVIGAQWGDEGKGKVVDIVTPHVDVVARYNGGNNAGHTVVIGALATVLALVLDIVAYESFLFLIGSVFVPLIGTFVVDYYLLRRHAWDVTDQARPRLRMLVPWAAGFVTYQLINPVQVPGWADFWAGLQADLGFVPPAWLSASLASLAVSAAVALAVGLPGRRRG